MAKILRPLTILAIIYCMAGVFLLIIERWTVGGEALRQALPIALTASIFFLHSAISLHIFHSLMRRRSGLMTGFYLGNKIIRLLVTIMLIVTYALIVKEGLLLFAVNAFALHIITMAYMGYYCIREEQKRKQIQT